MSYDLLSSGLGLMAQVPPAFLGLGQSVMQKTLGQPVECSGIGVHSGERVNLRLCPAREDTGIVFIRTDLLNGARTIKAQWDSVVDTRMCTVVGQRSWRQGFDRRASDGSAERLRHR